MSLATRALWAGADARVSGTSNFWKVLFFTPEALFTFLGAIKDGRTQKTSTSPRSKVASVRVQGKSVVAESATHPHPCTNVTETCSEATNPLRPAAKRPPSEKAAIIAGNET